jgi:hypothetical protein
MLRVALLDALLVGAGLRAMMGMRLGVFEMGATERVARNTSCSGIGCAVLVRSDCVDVWPLSFGGLKRTQLYLLACSLVTRALDFPTDGTDYQNYTPSKWRCRSRKLLADPPSNANEEGQKDKNIQQAGFPDGHPL